jgi:hypothetical protein
MRIINYHVYQTNKMEGNADLEMQDRITSFRECLIKLISSP